MIQMSRQTHPVGEQPTSTLVECDEGSSHVRRVRLDASGYAIGNCFRCGSLCDWNADEREWEHR